MRLGKIAWTAILLVAAIGMVSAMDYSTVLRQNGQLGISTPTGIQLSHGPFGIPTGGMDDVIVKAVAPGTNGAVIINFRDVPELSQKTLESITPVSER